MGQIRELQMGMKKWQRKNFPENFTVGKGYRALLGLAEEVGELSHAHLKNEESCRIGENHTDNKMDAIGDIFIYLASYCNTNDFDMENCIGAAWKEVSARDWLKFPKNGKTS